MIETEIAAKIRQIIGEGSSVNKVERLTEYVLTLDTGSGGNGGEKVNIFKPKSFDLRPIPYPDEMYVDYQRKDCFSLREKKGLTPVHYRDLVPNYITEQVFADPVGHTNKELELVVNISIRYQIAINEEGFDNLDKWGGLVMDVGFDVDSEPELSDLIGRVPVSVTRDHGNIVVMSANYTKVIRLPFGHYRPDQPRELTLEQLTYTFNNLRLACQLDWNRAGFTFEEYSEKVMWKEKAIELNPLYIHELYAEPFCVSVLDMNIVDVIEEEDIPQ